MANKYKGKAGSETTIKDLSTVLASKVYTEASWCTNHFKGESFNQAGTAGTSNISFNNFTVNGTAISGIKKGWFPTKEKCFLSLTTAGTHRITRSDSAITVTYASGTTSTFAASSFRDGVVPYRILAVTVGGGGGGAGGGWYEYEKDAWVHYCGGAGGGGGVSVSRLDLTTGVEYQIYVGAGGGYGTEGASEPDGGSNGTSGGNGGTSSVVSEYYRQGFCGAEGGKGGNPGIGVDGGGNGTGGAGGAPISYGSTLNSMTGGTGNSYHSHSSTGTAGLSCTPTSGTGAGSWEVCASKSNNGTYENANDTTSNQLSFFSGGCSYSYGSWWSLDIDTSTSTATLTPHPQTSGGGGGFAGCAGSNCATGAVYLYY